MMEAFLAQERKHGKHWLRDQVTMADWLPCAAGVQTRFSTSAISSPIQR